MKRRRRRAPRSGGIAALLLLAVFLGFFTLSPRHRNFYLRIFDGASQKNSTQPPSLSTFATQSHTVAEPRASSLPPAPPSSGPSAPEVASQPRLQSGRAAGGERSPSPKAPLGAGAGGERGRPSSRQAALLQPPPPVPRSGQGDRVVVRIIDESPARLPLSSPPLGWELKEFSGKGRVEVVKDDNRLAFRLVSEGSSFALYRDVVLDPEEFPVLRWAWKTIALPVGGDIRERKSDDQAIQVYVIFPRWPFPRVNSDVIGYIWDSRAPLGLKLTSPQSGNVKLVVLQSGREKVGRWIQEERNVYRDYMELFGKKPLKVGKVAVMIDSNDTRSSAEAYVHDLTFLRGPSPAIGAPPS